MQQIQFIIIFLLALVLAGCVQVQQEVALREDQLAVSSVRDLPINYPANSNFSLSPRYVKEASIKPEQVQKIYRLYAEKIAAGLQQQGYRLAEINQSADFYVGFGLALAEDLTDNTMSRKFGVSPGLQKVDELEKGSFLIYVEDAATDQRVWRGAVQGFVQEGISLAERNQRAEKVVNIVLSHFYDKG